MVMYVTDELGYDILCLYYCFFEIMTLFLYSCLDVATSQQRDFVSTKKFIQWLVNLWQMVHRTTSFSANKIIIVWNHSILPEGPTT
jgi:hypothetical protein